MGSTCSTMRTQKPAQTTLARIAQNIADAKKGFRAAAAAGFDLDVVEGYARVQGRAAFTRALKPEPLPQSIFRGGDDEAEGRRTTSRAIKGQHAGLGEMSNVSMIEFRAIWLQLKPLVPPPPQKAPKLDMAIALKQANAIQVSNVSQAVRVH